MTHQGVAPEWKGPPQNVASEPNSEAKPFVGQVFGRLTVVRFDTNIGYWITRCSCGGCRVTSASLLRSGKAYRCGECTKREYKRGSFFKEDIAGRTFESLTALGYDSARRNWVTRCMCGGERLVCAKYLRDGKVTKCTTCIRKDRDSESLIGRVFGDLTVVRYEKPQGWLCRCVCGGARHAHRLRLLSGEAVCCSGCNAPRVREKATRDLRGQTHGHLTVLERHEVMQTRKKLGAAKAYVTSLWRCRCICGKIVENVRGPHLVTGQIVSCGCKRVPKHLVDGVERTAVELARMAGVHIGTMWSRLRRGMTGEEAVAVGRYPKKKAPYHRATYVLHGKPVMLKDVAARLGISVSRIAWHLRKAKVRRTLEEVVALFRPKPAAPAWVPPKQITASSVDKCEQRPGRKPNRALVPAPSRALPPDVVVTPAWATVLRYQAGDPKAGNDLLREHHGLIYKYAKKFAFSYIDFDELLQESRMGALEGFRRCDIVKAAGGSPTTYAMWWAKHFVERYVVNHRSNVRVPSGAQEKGTRVSMKSIDEEPEDGKAPFVLASKAPRVDAQIDDAETRAHVRKMLEVLDEREREILERRFGFGDYDDARTLEEVGDVFGVSRERIRQIQKEAFEKIRAAIARAPARDRFVVDVMNDLLPL